MSDAPCGLPAELWRKEILSPANGFLMTAHGALVSTGGGAFLDIRALRLTCTWFARHLSMDQDAHDGFWPAVEDYIRRGHADALFKLDWPTHPRCSILTGYACQNYSYGRAGAEAIKRSDKKTLALLLVHGRVWWTFWLTTAIELKCESIIKWLLKDVSSQYYVYQSHAAFGHLRPRDAALEEKDSVTLLWLDNYL